MVAQTELFHSAENSLADHQPMSQNADIEALKTMLDAMTLEELASFMAVVYQAAI